MLKLIQFNPWKETFLQSTVQQSIRCESGESYPRKTQTISDIKGIVLYFQMKSGVPASMSMCA